MKLLSKIVILVIVMTILTSWNDVAGFTNPKQVHNDVRWFRRHDLFTRQDMIGTSSSSSMDKRFVVTSKSSSSSSSPTSLSLSQSGSSPSWKDLIRQQFNSFFTGNDNQSTIDKTSENGTVPAAATTTRATNTQTTRGSGTVVRLANRKYNVTSSKPSDGGYTTRKDAQSSIVITQDGVEDDYNHYRTIALKSTKSRAISILTTDVMNSLRATYQTKFKSQTNIQDGDLGENILIDGVAFTYFQIRKRYRFVKQHQQQEEEREGSKKEKEPCYINFNY